MKLHSFKNSLKRNGVLDTKKDSNNFEMKNKEKKEYNNSITTNRKSVRLIHLNNEITNLEKKNKYEKNEKLNIKKKTLTTGKMNDAISNYKKEILLNGSKNITSNNNKGTVLKHNKRKVLKENKDILSISNKKKILYNNKSRLVNNNKNKLVKNNKINGINNDNKKRILKISKKKDTNNGNNRASKKQINNKSENKKINKKVIDKKKTDNRISKKGVISKRVMNMKNNNTNTITKDSNKKIKNIYSKKENNLKVLGNEEIRGNCISECKVKKKNILDNSIEILKKDKNTLQKYDFKDANLNKKVKKYNDSFMEDNFFQKKLKKRKLATNNTNNSRMKEINKFIKEFIKNNNLNTNCMYNNKYNIYSYGKGSVFYYLERINQNNEKKKKINNKIKLNVISEVINIKKKKFIIGSSNRKCDLVLKGNIESEQCELICKCVEKNVNKTNDKNRQINKYNLFIVNKSSSNSTILNDSIISFEQIKDEDNIFLGMDDVYNKDSAKYIYKIKYNKIANIFNLNNFYSYNKNCQINFTSNKTEKCKASKIVSNNFSLSNQNGKIRISQENEEESKITILIFLIIENNYITDEPIYNINYLNHLNILNNTPRKSLENEKILKNTPSINKMLKEDSPNTKFNESFQKINSICQSRLSPLGIKDSIKKEEKVKGILKNCNSSKELPVTLLNACAELCKEINKSVSKENCKADNFLQKSTSIINNSNTPPKSISYSNKKNIDQNNLQNVKHMNNMYNLFNNNFSINSCSKNKNCKNNRTVDNDYNNEGINTNKDESNNNSNTKVKDDTFINNSSNDINTKNICDSLYFNNNNCNNEDININKEKNNNNIILEKVNGVKYDSNKNNNVDNDKAINKKENNNNDIKENNNNDIKESNNNDIKESNNNDISGNNNTDINGNNNNINNINIYNDNSKDISNNNYIKSNNNDTYINKYEENKDENNKEDSEDNNNRGTSSIINIEANKNNCNYKDYNSNNEFKIIKNVDTCKVNVLNNKLDDDASKEKTLNFKNVENAEILQNCNNFLHENNTVDKKSLKDEKDENKNNKINCVRKNCSETNIHMHSDDLYYKVNYDDIYLKKYIKVKEKEGSHINMDDNIFTTPTKNGICLNSNKSIFFDCKEEKIDDCTPLKNKEYLKSSEFNEFLKNPKKSLFSFLYSKNNENISNNNFIICLKNEEGKEKYLKVIGEIKVKRNANFSSIKHSIDIKLLDKSIELKTLNNINDLKYEDISTKKYSIYLNAFSDKLDESKFNEFSALHLDYIDNVNFSDIDILESFELKKMLFIKYDD